MTTLPIKESNPKAEPRADRAGATIWGLGLEALHDRYWASRRVQVVRARSGSSTVDAAGPALYLLVDAPQLALFDLAPVLRRLNWLKPRIARIRLAEIDRSAYVERVITGADGRLQSVRREYGARTRSTSQVLLTPDVRIARQWADNDGGRECRRALLKVCGRDRCTTLSISGRYFNARNPVDADRFRRAMITEWRRPDVVIDGVYSFQPDVWMHESVEMAPGVRLIGPLWIGAGVEFSPGDLVIGPRIIGDEIPHTPLQPVDWDDLRTAAWRLTARPITARRLFGKRAFDIVFSLAVLFFTAPLYPIIILAIFIEDGWPPFFTHQRQTVRGRNFPCLKFRTMRKDAESMKEQLAAMNQADGPQFFIEDDPRILMVGKFLRKTQLDEFPQFINVLLGHMSVVGPRPSPDKENQYCPAWREARLSVRPGVTGLWQVRRTREPQTDFQEWIKYDLEYIQHRSWRLDFIIILQTVKKVFGG